MKSLKLTVLFCLLAISTLTVNGIAAGNAFLVFPFYTSGVGMHDTKMTIYNADTVLTNPSTAIHVMMIDGSASSDSSCSQLDFYLCLAPQASIDIDASEYDPMVACGYMLAAAVDATTGVPLTMSCLTGSATVNMPAGTLAPSAGVVAGGYNAEGFNPSSVTTGTGTATLVLPGVGTVLSTTVQSSTLGQTIITVGLNGDVNAATQTGAAQSSVGTITNSKAKLVSYSNFLTGKCQAKGTFTNVTPRVAFRLTTFLGGMTGNIKIPIGGGVGLSITPGGAITSLTHITNASTMLTVPRYDGPICPIALP